MKQELKNAYDRMNPPPGAKERIMRNIQNQNKVDGKYQSEPTVSHSWSAIPALLVLAVVLAVGWWMLIPRADTPVSVDPTQTTGPEVVHHDILDLATMFPDMPEEYWGILATYYTALAGDYDETYWENHGLNTAAYAWLDVIDGLGYALMDLDGDGNEELLITDGDQVYDLYTFIDYEVHELLGNKIQHEGKRVSIKLCEDNIVMVWQRSSGMEDYITWYQLGKDGLGMTALTSVETVFIVDTDHWYAGPNEKDAVEVTEEEAREILNSREPVTIDLLPICPEKYKINTDTIPEGYAYILDKYVRASNENWTVEEYMENDISHALKDLDITCDYGYTLMDLNRDGIKELLITDGELIYDIYILKEDGSTFHLATGWEQNRLYWCKENLILNEQSGGAALTAYVYYQFDGMDLMTVQAVVHDGIAVNGPWYVGDTLDSMKSATASDAQAIFDAYVREYLEFTPIVQDAFQLIPGQEGSYPDTYAQLLKDLIGLSPEMEDLFICLVDISGDGVSELLLGTENSFGHVYAMVDGSVEYILSYGKNEGFTLCENGVVMYHQPDKEFGYYTFISMKDNKPVTIDEIRYDEEAKSWFRYGGIGKAYITDEEMQHVLASYNKLSLTMIPVSAYLAGEGV